MDYFKPDNASHRMRWPEYHEFIVAKNAELRDQFAQYVGLYGLIPYSLRQVHNSRFRDPTFYASHNLPLGIAWHHLESIDLTFTDWDKSLSLVNPSQVELDTAKLLGIDPWEPARVSYLNELLANYSIYCIQRAALDNSDAVAMLKSKGWDWQYEQRDEQCLLVIPDTKAAIYMKMAFP